jgi:aminoglycoside 6'-N-acetyltransferase
VADMFIRERDLAIRLMKDDDTDYSLMARWLTDPRVLEFYEGRDNPFSIDRIREEYSPRVLQLEHVTPCLLIFEDSPIGYVQFYPVTADRCSYGLENETETDNLYGMDQFIGETGLWNRGLGSRAASLLLQYLFQVRGARKVILDPRVSNQRAIRCYEKCSFRRVKILPHHELHEGEYRDSWLMEVSVDSFRAVYFGAAVMPAP